MLKLSHHNVNFEHLLSRSALRWQPREFKCKVQSAKCKLNRLSNSRRVVEFWPGPGRTAYHSAFVADFGFRICLAASQCVERSYNEVTLDSRGRR